MHEKRNIVIVERFRFEDDSTLNYGSPSGDSFRFSLVLHAHCPLPPPHRGAVGTRERGRYLFPFRMAVERGRTNPLIGNLPQFVYGRVFTVLT